MRDSFIVAGANQIEKTYCSSCTEATVTIKFKNKALCRECNHMKGIYAGD